ncbi:hypothetical protein BHU72_07380 [Desulfuribacillus stibiiarsenatis]|uniref:Phosphonate ABC transporter substrate-binding protein n=1 Tax=Desulfuribacillus stibiiarsenatis TaxID=1390249 RepID=A0A1E5L4I1_9FIRM|nr:phosphate/phosphite/phosphonate ABC transporter substrate-binding protein [Desulfuribacillus stibiiarsenatis]OEH85001.1 hypothetical protein BHU72_07380 [Desulfuribacillus stibiiarsenatis]
MLNRKTMIFMAIIPLLLGTIFLYEVLNRNDKEYDVVFADLEEYNSKQNIEGQKLRVALATGISPKSNLQYYTDLMHFIEQKTGFHIEVIQRKSYSEINNLLSLNLIDVALICSSSYVILENEVDLLVAPEFHGEHQYQSFIIVKSDSDIHSFNQLQGKTFAFSDPISTTGFFYPKSLLLKSNHTMDSYFANYFFTYSHDNSIYSVINGLADGAAVDSTIFRKLTKQDPLILEKLRVINSSPYYCNSPIVASKNLSPDIKKRLIDALISINDSAEDKELFQKYGITGYHDEKTVNYKVVKDLVHEVLNESK